MKYLRLETADRITTLTLNRPAKQNSLSLELMAELAGAVESLRGAQDTVVILLTGAGKAFCAGIDPDLLASLSSSLPVSEVRQITQQWQHTLSALESLPQVTLAVLNGPVLGAGLELALCCDMRFASSKASFGMPEVKYGLVPALGGISRLVRSIGLARAKEVVLRARNFSPMEALRLGLVNRVGEPGDVMGQARQWAEFFVQTPAHALTFAKQLLNAAPTQSLDEALRAALEAQVELLRSPEFAEVLLRAQAQPETQ